MTGSLEDTIARVMDEHQGCVGMPRLIAHALRAAGVVPAEPATHDTPRTVGPCGDPAEVPDVTVRRVNTADGPRIEMAMLSAAYCWRVRSWWSPTDAHAIAERIRAAVAAVDGEAPADE